MAAAGGTWRKGKFVAASVKKKTAEPTARAAVGKKVDQMSREELLALQKEIAQQIAQSETAEGNKKIKEKEKKKKFKAGATVGKEVETFGQDPRVKYAVRYELVEMDDLVTSNTATGAVNPEFPTELQPRDRTRASSQLQIKRIASDLNPDALTTEFRSLDRGAPIIGKDDNVVESGNGRTLSLRLAAQEYPEQYERYKDSVKAVAAKRGIDPAAVDGMRQPVLVRRRVADVDRVAFAREANSAAVLGMSDTERARTDARRVSSEMLQTLQIGANDDLDAALGKAGNRPFVRSFVSQLPDNERAELVTRTGELTQTGQRRIKGAIFNRTFDSPELSDRIFESNDNDIRNITNGLVASAAKVGQAEELIRSGKRGADYSLAPDVVAATRKYADLRSQGQSVAEYQKQGALFGRELTPTQERLLVVLDENKRSGKRVREIFDSYADRVINSPDPNQGALFGGAKQTREEFISRWLDDIETTKQPQRQASMF
jgi:hypothetical protein